MGKKVVASKVEVTENQVKKSSYRLQRRRYLIIYVTQNKWKYYERKSTTGIFAGNKRPV